MSKRNEGGVTDLGRQIGQLFRFSLVGGLNTLIDFGVFTLLVQFFGGAPLLSHGFSYTCGVINSYFLNRFWTFKVRSRMGLLEFGRFVVVNLVSLGVSMLVLYLSQEVLGWNVYLGKLLATLCALVINFLGSKLLVFSS